MEVSGKKTDTGQEECDSKLGNVCEPCQGDTITTQASGYCKDCGEYMCDTCFRHHLRGKLCRHHVLIDVDMANLPVHEGKESERKCYKHNGETTKFYCRKHYVVGCGDCMVLEHNVCKLEYVKDASTNFHENEAFKSLVTKIEILTYKCQEIKDSCHEYEQNNMLMLEKALEDIRKFRADINRYLDAVEANVISEAKRIMSDNDILLTKLTQDCKELSFKIEKVKQMFNTELYEDNVLFINTVEWKPRVTELEQEIALTHSKTMKQFEFVCDQQLHEFVTSSKQLGSLSISQTVPRHQTTQETEERDESTQTRASKSENNYDRTEKVALPSTKIDSNMGSYSSGSSYQSAGYQSQKSAAGYQSSSKPGSYSDIQYQPQSALSQSQSDPSQFSSQSEQSSQNQYQSGSSKFPTDSPSGYQSSQSIYQSNQQQYQSDQSQFQNNQSGSTFQNQSVYSSNQPNSSVLYPNNTSTSYSSQSQQNSLHSHNSRPSSHSNHCSSAFKENQSGASSERRNVRSSSKTRDSQSDSCSTYNMDTHSTSTFSDSQSMAYNRDSQSVGNSYNRDPSNSFKRDSKSASGSYPRDTPSTDSGAYSRDSQSASSASYTGRDSQSSTTGFRDTQTGSSGYAGQAGSYPRDASQSQSQAGYSAKNYRNSTEVTSLASSFTGSKLVDNFSKMAVKDGPLDTIQSSNSQFDSVSSTSKVTTNTTSLTSSTTSSTISSTGTTVISSTTTKISTLPSASSTSSKAPPNLPPGVPLMAQQYIMGQGTLPFYGLQGLQGLQQPLYANLEDIQYLQQRMPPLDTSSRRLGSQQTVSHTQSKTASKSYTSISWEPE